jgi:hypothetical protein
MENGELTSRSAGRTQKLPVFGKHPGVDEYKQWLAGLEVQMLRCGGLSPDGERLRVDIVHFSSNPKTAKSEMDKIVSFLTDRGLDPKLETNPTSWTDADVLIIGSDQAHAEQAGHLISYVPSVLGIDRRWDVLAYSTEGMINSSAPIIDRPLCAGPKFSMDAICMIHAHLRRRIDVGTWRARLILIQIRIEMCIDEVLGWSDREFAYKVKKFKRKITDDDMWGPDAELFFAAVEMLRDTRNLVSHVYNRPQKRQEKDAAESIKKDNHFHMLLNAYKRYDIGPPSTGPSDYVPRHPKYYTKIANLAYEWAAAYSRRCDAASQPDAWPT